MERKVDGDLVMHQNFLSQRAMAALLEDMHRSSDGRSLKVQVHQPLIETLQGFCRRNNYDMLRRTNYQTAGFQFFRLIPKSEMFPPTHA